MDALKDERVQDIGCTLDVINVEQQKRMVMIRRVFLEAFAGWLPVAIAVTCLAGLVYLTVQQNIRSSANDPQIQLAQDAATALSHAVSPQQIIPTQQIDIATSLAPYLMVFRDSGELIATSGYLNGQTPVVPSGVFAYVRDHGEDRFTWEPQRGVRSAAIVERFAGAQPGFVLAGRSMREIERREDQLLWIVAAASVVTLVATLGGAIAAQAVRLVR